MVAMATSCTIPDGDEQVEIEPEAVEDTFLPHSFVEEAEELLQLVNMFMKQRGMVDSSVVKRACDICKNYCEQPQLLDPHLEKILSPLTTVLREEAQSAESANWTAVKRICCLIQCLAAVRGSKTVAQFFPHGPEDLEPALALLGCCSEMKQQIFHDDGGDAVEEIWMTHSVLLLWLSILALIPFDLISVDTSLTLSHSSKEAKEGIPPLVQRMVSMCWDYLDSPNRPVMNMAALLLSRLLTRPDMQKALQSFVQRAGEVVAVVQEGRHVWKTEILLQGVVSTLAAIFKVGGRDVLLQQSSKVWTCVAEPLAACAVSEKNALLRRLRMKLLQRLGLAELPPRLATWRYHRGSRSLDRTLSRLEANKESILSSSVIGRGSEVDGIEKHETEGNDGEEEIDVPEVIEDVIQELLNGLRDKDTSVRWSAAKGLGRITGRLPLPMADDVLEALMALFHSAEGDGAWHGGCLAMAELARRGLLLPHRLPSVVPLVSQALHYEVQQGTHSVGGHVRDAAAYVCWAFARAYSPEVMSVPLKELAPALLTAACYDREVKCRRAAAAAFQEGVGRQGNFPHGIAIVTAADFAALGPLRHAYRKVALQIAQFEEYRQPLLQELLHVKVQHWNKDVRELAAESMALLVPLDTHFFQESVMDQLLPSTLAGELRVRHGAVLALAEILPALHQQGVGLSSDRESAVVNVVLQMEKAQLFRGKGGEMMRVAASRLVQSMAMTSLPCDASTCVALISSLESHLVHPSEEVQTAAAIAFGAVAQTPAFEGVAQAVTSFMERQVSLLEGGQTFSSLELARRGAALALGCLPRALLWPVWHRALSALCHAATFTDAASSDVETRVNAVKALGTCCTTFGVVVSSEPPSVQGVGGEKEGGEERTEVGLLQNETKGVPASVVMGLVVESLLLALEDYAKDHRGDVGSLVREAAMVALLDVMCLLATATERQKEHPQSDRAFQSVQGREMRPGSMQTSEIERGADCVKSNHESMSNAGLDERLAVRVVGALAKQAVEKIDRTRAVGGRVLHALLWALRADGQPLFQCIPQRSILEQLLPRNAGFNWGNERETYTRFVPLLALSEYRAPLLAGLVVAVGGLAEPLATVATSALMDLLSMPDRILSPAGSAMVEDVLLEGDGRWISQSRDIMPEDNLVQKIARELLLLLKHQAHNDRVIVPALKTLDILLAKGAFAHLQGAGEPFGTEAIEQLGREFRERQCRDIPKLYLAVNVFCHFVAWPAAVAQPAFAQILLLLGNPYPKVRQYCAEQAYLQLLTLEGSEEGVLAALPPFAAEDATVEDRVEAALDLLSGTDWRRPLRESAAARARLKELIPV